MNPQSTSLAAMAADLQTRFDHEVEPLLARYRDAGGHLHCRRGCSRCCTLAIHAPLPEAQRVAETLPPGLEQALTAYVERLREETSGLSAWKEYLGRHRRAVGPCPFLADDGACAIYARRPLTCRALFSTRPADWCAVDFADLSPWDRTSYLSSLDPAVVAWPTHYLGAPQALGRDLETGLLAAMQTRLGLRLSGNLPLLVWLLRRTDLATRVTRGAEAVAALLAAEGWGGPPLIELEADGKSP